MERINKKWIAKIIRIITVPPFLVATLIILLAVEGGNVLSGKWDRVVAWIGLVILPVLAYPVQKIIRSKEMDARTQQRELAFKFSILGYTGSFVYGIISSDQKNKLFFTTYFLTAMFLLICNKVLHIRASGHTAASASPCLFSTIWISIRAGIAYACVFILSIWASLILKRHEKRDILAGIICFVAAFSISYMIFGSIRP